MKCEVMERFLAKCCQSDSGCILWKAAKRQDGYAQFFFRGQMRVAHRVSWELFKGPIPPGLQVNHKCDVRDCVNPEHLYLGTQIENMADMYAKGRGRKRPLRGEDNPASRLNREQVAQIRAIGGSRTQREVAEQFGVSQMIISRILRREIWRHV